MREMIYPAPAVAVPSPPPTPLEEVRLVIESAEVVAWHLPAPDDPARPAVLFLHGNGQNLQTMRLAGSFAMLAKLDVGVLALDYPGYGRSGGRPTEASVMAAAGAALEWLRERYPGRPLVVVGWSLGAAVAVGLAAESPEVVAGLVALSPWTSLPAVAKRHFPGLLVGMLLHEEYDSLAAAERVRSPALVAHGALDQVIPAAQGRELSRALGPTCTWLEIVGAGHNDLLSVSDVWRAIRGFLDEL